MHNTQLEEDVPLSTHATNKANALAAIYRMSKVPRKTAQVKVTRVKRLNDLHASGAFDVEDKDGEEQVRERKKSEKYIMKTINLDDFDDLQFEGRRITLLCLTVTLC